MKERKPSSAETGCAKDNLLSFFSQARNKYDVHVAREEHLDIERCQVLERCLDLLGASRKEIHAPEAPVREHRVPRDENLVLPVEQADRALGVPGRDVNLELVIPGREDFLVFQLTVHVHVRQDEIMKGIQSGKIYYQILTNVLLRLANEVSLAEICHDTRYETISFFVPSISRPIDS